MFISTPQWESSESKSAYKYCLIVGLHFMACIAIERHLLVSHPIWYRTHLSVKFSCFICFIIWLMPLNLCSDKKSYHKIPWTVPMCFIPYPIILLCFVGTWKGFSHTTSHNPHVPLNYTLLILPNAIKVFIKFFGFSVSQRISNFFFTVSGI